MEKRDKSSQGSESDDSSNVEVAEEMEDESQQQDNPDGEMRDDQIAELRNETVDFPGGTNNESGEISQPKVEQCEESMPNVSEELAGSTGTECEAVAGKCQNQSTIQVTAQKAGDAAADEASKQPTKINYTGGKLINEFFDAYLPGKHSESESNEEIPERVEEQQNVHLAERNLEVGRDLEQGEKPEQELQVQEIGQVIEFVLEEAVICHARQERMEEAEDIEEPQKYAFREKNND